MTRAAVIALLLGAPCAFAGPPTKLPRPPAPPATDTAGLPLPTPVPPAPANQAPLRLRAEVLEKDGPALAVLTDACTRQVAFTADGAWLVYGTQAGLFAWPAREGDAHQVGPPAPYFALTPDSRFALTPEAAWRRLSLSGRDGPITLAKGEALGALTGSSLSSRHVAFNAANGALVVASIDEGTALTLPLELPEDRRCHAGAAYPRGFSDDGAWLLLQRGCSAMDAVRPDGTGLTRLPTASVVLVGHLAVGQRLEPKSGLPLAKELLVTPLDGGAPFTIPGANLSPFARPLSRAAAVLQDDGEGRLTWVDLEKKQVRVLYEGAQPALPFFEATPDGTRALFATRGEGRCAVHQVDVRTGKRQQLAEVEGAEQCFIKPAGDARAVLYAWRPGEAVVARVDLKTGAVRRLGPPMSEVGNFYVTEHSVAVSAGSRLLVARLQAAPRGGAAR